MHTSNWINSNSYCSFQTLLLVLLSPSAYIMNRWYKVTYIVFCIIMIINEKYSCSFNWGCDKMTVDYGEIMTMWWCDSVWQPYQPGVYAAEHVESFLNKNEFEVQVATTTISLSVFSATSPWWLVLKNPIWLEKLERHKTVQVIFLATYVPPPVSTKSHRVHFPVCVCVLGGGQSVCCQISVGKKNKIFWVFLDFLSKCRSLTLWTCPLHFYNWLPTVCSWSVALQRLKVQHLQSK